MSQLDIAIPTEPLCKSGAFAPAIPLDGRTVPSILFKRSAQYGAREFSGGHLGPRHCRRSAACLRRTCSVDTPRSAGSMPAMGVRDARRDARREARRPRNASTAQPALAGIKRGARGRHLPTQIGCCDQMPPANDWRGWPSLDLKRESKQKHLTPPLRDSSPSPRRHLV